MTAGRSPWVGSKYRVIAVAFISFLLVATSASAQNVFPASGNVGIGTTNPGDLVDIMTTGAGTGLRLIGTVSAPNNAAIAALRQSSSGGGGLFLRDPAGITTQVVIQSGGDSFLAGGNVGIGTTTPGSLLHLKLNAASGSSIMQVQSTSPTQGPFLRFTPGAASPRSWSIGASTDGSLFAVRSAAAANGDPASAPSSMVVDGNGNVGIGTNAPAAMLHVAGNAQVDGNIGAKYQDVAEWVPAHGALGAGTVVVIDTSSGNVVTASDGAYDTRVAGVVSSQPGVLLGEPGEGKVKVANSGRVRVKVNANYGPVTAGDLLVTSPTPGYAMRSEPLNIGGLALHRPGTLIGKALEQLKEGQGEILVLLTLQ